MQSKAFDISVNRIPAKPCLSKTSRHFTTKTNKQCCALLNPFGNPHFNFKKGVKIVVYTTLYIDFRDTRKNANRSVNIFQKFFVFFEGGCYIGSYKLWYNIYDQISIFSFNILIGKSYCCVALLELRLCISLESLVSSLKENVQFELLILFLIFIMLGC